MSHVNRVSAALMVSLCVSSFAPAAASTVPDHPHATPRYRLVDAGTAGSSFGLFSNPASRVVNRHGTAVGMNSTAASDPFTPNCFYDCQVDHAFVWKQGRTTDLGALTSEVSSFAYWINDRGLAVGVSQNGLLDPLTGFPQGRAVLWRNGQIFDLGTLGGTQSAAYAVNRRGQIAGVALNAQLDPFANLAQAACLWLPTGGGCRFSDFAFNAFFAPSTTQARAVLWTRRGMLDLGTLGGPDSTATLINDRGQVAGWSYTSYVANASGVPDVHPFVWENGRMTDLGSLGGSVGAPSSMNSRGQVAGVSNLTGDAVMHPFLWSRATGMRDLGTLGGTYAHPDWVNDNGDVVGYSTTADVAGHHLGSAFYWHRGRMTNLGTIGTDQASEAFGINNRGLIVGETFVPGGDDLHGFLSDNGGPLIALDTLVVPASTIHVITAVAINDRGEIVGSGLLPDGSIHPIVLVPCDDANCDQGNDDAAEESGGVE